MEPVLNPLTVPTELIISWWTSDVQCPVARSVSNLSGYMCICLKRLRVALCNGEYQAVLADQDFRQQSDKVGEFLHSLRRCRVCRISTTHCMKVPAS